MTNLHVELDREKYHVLNRQDWEDYERRPGTEPEPEYIPTTQDLSDYAQWAAEVDRRWWDDRIEREDRMETMERIRSQAWNRARIAVSHVEGIAAALSANGMDSTARNLLAAAGNIDAVLRQYA